METVGLFYTRKDSLRNLCSLHDGRLDTNTKVSKIQMLLILKWEGFTEDMEQKTNFKI